jgi:hypothetical protein
MADLLPLLPRRKHPSSARTTDGEYTENGVFSGGTGKFLSDDREFLSPLPPYVEIGWLDIHRLARDKGGLVAAMFQVLVLS